MFLRGREEEEGTHTEEEEEEDDSEREEEEEEREGGREEVCVQLCDDTLSRPLSFIAKVVEFAREDEAKTVLKRLHT